jgi:hypothetical protein
MDLRVTAFAMSGVVPEGIDSDYYSFLQTVSSEICEPLPTFGNPIGGRAATFHIADNDAEKSIPTILPLSFKDNSIPLPSCTFTSELS